jgi:hypothetical protein
MDTTKTRSIMRIMQARLLWILSEHGRTMLLVIIMLMAVYAVLSLGNQFWRLVSDEDWLGDIDLKHIYYEIHVFSARICIQYTRLFPLQFTGRFSDGSPLKGCAGYGWQPIWDTCLVIGVVCPRERSR